MKHRSTAPEGNDARIDGGLTRPFGFASRVDSPRLRIDPIPLIDLGLVGLLLFLLQSPMIFQPGFAVELPQSRSVELSGAQVSRVLTVSDSGAFLIDGRLFNHESSLAVWLGNHPPRSEDEVLLVKISRHVPLDQMLGLVELLQSAGFHRLQIAARPRQTP